MSHLTFSHLYLPTTAKVRKQNRDSLDRARSRRRFAILGTGLIAFCVAASVPQAQGQDKEGDRAARHLERAESLSSADDPQAETEFRKAIAIRKGVYPEAWAEYSYYLAAKVRFSESAGAIRKALKQDSTYHAVAKERLQLLDRAIELKTKVDEKKLLPPEEMVEWIRLNHQFGGVEAALPHAEQAVNAYPDSTEVLTVYADLVSWDQKELALELLNRAVSLEPSRAEAYSRRGWFYYWKLSWYEKAEADFRKAIELSSGKSSSSWQGLGDTLAMLGKKQEAIEAYKTYLKIRPDSAAHYDAEIKKQIRELSKNLETSKIHP